MFNYKFKFFLIVFLAFLISSFYTSCCFGAIKDNLPSNYISSLSQQTPRMDIIYTRFTPYKENWQLCLYHLPSKKVEVLIDTQKYKALGNYIQDAVFSPDGSKILFLAAKAKSLKDKMKTSSEEGFIVELWVFNLRNKKLTQITKDGPQGYSDANWSPDGSYISATCSGDDIPDAAPGTFVTFRNLILWNTGNYHKKEILKRMNSFEWMPNSKGLLAIDEYGKLIIYDLMLRKKKVLKKDTELDAKWLSNSKHLIISSMDDKSLYSISKSGKDKVLLADKVFYSLFSELSPNGSKLILQNSANRDLMMLNIINKHINKLLSNSKYSSSKWSPDSKNISMTSSSLIDKDNHNGPFLTTVAALNTDTQILTELISLPDYANIIGWSKDGKYIIVINNSYERIVKNKVVIRLISNPQEIFVIDTDNKSHIKYGLPTTSTYSVTTCDFSYKDSRIY